MSAETQCSWQRSKSLGRQWANAFEKQRVSAEIRSLLTVRYRCRQLLTSTVALCKARRESWVEDTGLQYDQMDFEFVPYARRSWERIDQKSERRAQGAVMREAGTWWRAMMDEEDGRRRKKVEGEETIQVWEKMGGSLAKRSCILMSWKVRPGLSIMWYMVA